MPLNALSLSVTQGVQGRPFQATINGLTTGRVEVLADGSPGFSTVNGKVMAQALPYPVSTVVLREYEPGVGQGYRDSRIDILSATRASLLAQAQASLASGRSLVRFQAVSERQPDGSTSYTLIVQDDLGASRKYVPDVPSMTPAPSPTLGALTLSDASFQRGAPKTINILGATLGSTIAATSTPAGFSVDSAARTVAYDGTGSGAATPTLALTETLAGATNSPRTSNVALAIGAAITPPTERSFTYSEYQQGWTLVREETSNPARLRLNNTRDFTSASHYMAVVTGTDARATLNSLFKTSLGDREAGLYFEVSVDGGAYTRTPYNSATDDFQLFSGLPDTSHIVAIRTPAELFETVYIDKGASPLKVKGTAPAIKLVDQWLQPGQPNANVHAGNGFDGFSDGPNGARLVGGSLVNLANAAVTPQKFTDYRSGGTPSMVFRANVTELWFVTGQRVIHVWDGTQMRVVDTGFDALGGDYRGGDSIRVARLTGLSGLKSYYVWTSSNGQPVYLSVGLVGGTAQPLTEGNRTLDQYGDSITEGVTATAPNTKPENDRGYLDPYRVGARLGYTGVAIGKAGYTVANLNTDLPGWLERKIVTSADVAIIAIGQNNGVPDTSVYNAIIDKLLAKGYGKVICRGVIPVQSGNSTAINATIEDIVNGRADPKVKYLNVNSWTSISRPDTIHPDVNGYNQIVDLSVAALPALLA